MAATRSTARLEIGVNVPLTARFASRPVDSDPLAVEVDVFHRHSYSLFSAERSELHHHRHVAEALLEVVECLG